MIGDFSDKPVTAGIYATIESYVLWLGTVTSQVGFSVNRKFLRAWAYEKTLDGALRVIHRRQDAIV